MQPLKQNTKTTFAIIIADLAAHWRLALLILAALVFTRVLSTEFRFFTLIYALANIWGICIWHQTCLQFTKPPVKRRYSQVLATCVSYLFSTIYLSIGTALICVIIAAPIYSAYGHFNQILFTIGSAFWIVFCIYAFTSFILNFAIGLPEAALGKHAPLPKSKLSHPIFSRMHLITMALILLLLNTGLIKLTVFTYLHLGWVKGIVVLSVYCAFLLLFTGSILNALYRQYYLQFQDAA